MHTDNKHTGHSPSISICHILKWYPFTLFMHICLVYPRPHQSLARLQGMGGQSDYKGPGDRGAKPPDSAPPCDAGFKITQRVKVRDSASLWHFHHTARTGLQIAWGISAVAFDGACCKYMQFFTFSCPEGNLLTWSSDHLMWLMGTNMYSEILTNS